MFKSYFKIALRNLVKNKFFSFINILGLAIGMGVAILIGLWIWSEISFDKYFTNHKTLAEIVSITTYNGSTTAHKSASAPLANELRQKVPDDFQGVALTSEGGYILSANETKVDKWGMWAESKLPEMLTLKMLSGNNMLTDPTSIIISKSLAKTLFNNEKPLNNVIHVDNKTVMKIVGVYEDIPENTSFFGVDYFLAWNNKDNPGNDELGDWTNHHFKIYVQLDHRADASKISQKIKDITKPHLRGAWEEIMVFPMDRWHLYNEFSNGKMSTGSIQYVWLF